MPSLGVVLGESAAMVAVRGQIRRLLRSSARRLPPVLILGETGTGKGLLAASIHRGSARASGPFVDVDCSAIPDTLIEAELFGFERGAFTDARQAKRGLFQAANGGTIFLDEVGLLPLAMQAKLLKVIEERSVRRLGSTRSEPLDVAIVAATSEDLPAAVQAARFRPDLFHRLAVVTVTLPPLRTRGRDVVLLAEHFLARACEDYGLPARTLTEDAHAALIGHPWPGNVRELANVLERAVLMSDGPRLTAADLTLSVAPAPRVGAAVTPADEDERRQLLDLLETADWNFSRAAAQLGVPRNTLRYRAERLGLAGPAPRRRGGRPPASREVVTPTPPVASSPERRRLTFLELRLVVEEAAAWELTRAVDATVEKVRSFGGFIEQAGPRAVGAVFGLEPDEDAPRRAAHAALAVQTLAARAQREDRRRPGATAALHTATVELVHRGERVQLDADSRDDARRALDAALERATAGTVVASADAARFLGRRFELMPLAGAPVWQVVRAAEPGRSRFVGRHEELRLLQERFERAHAGHGQVTVLVGEAGAGKSRLVHELRRQLGASATWMVGHALPFGSAMPLHPVIEMLKRVFRIDDGDPEAMMLEKLTRGVHRLGDDLDETLPFVRSLLGIDPGDAAVSAMDPRLRHAQTVQATHLLLERGAELRPHVLVLEDAHWADPATEDWISRLAGTLAAHRVLLLVTTRPGYRSPFGDLGFHTAITLAALSDVDTARIAADVLGAERLAPELQSLILDKADGNPFFVEELVRSLHERGVIEPRGADVVVSAPVSDALVPDTIQDVIMARIERLAAEPRRVLAVASVLGREFTRAVLDRVLAPGVAADTALGELAAAGLIHERRHFPEVEHAFRHALTHEVAYAAVAADERRALHRRIAQSLEALYAGRLAEMAPLLGRHYAAAEEWEKALAHFVRAAEIAATAFAAREALALYDEALRAAARLPGGGPARTVMLIHQARSHLHFVLSEFAQSYAAAAAHRELARASGDREQEGMALAAQGWAAPWARDLDSAMAHAREAIALAQPIGADTVLARAQFTFGFVKAVTGGLVEGKAAIADALRASRSAGDVVHQSLALTVAGLMKSWEGEYPEAYRLLIDANAVARQHNLLYPMLFNAFLRGVTLTAKGDYATALATFDDGTALAQKVGDEAIYHRLLNCRGWLHFELGDLATAADLNAQSAAIARRRRDDGTLANAEINLGDVLLARGDLAGAAETFAGMERMAADPATSPWMRYRYTNRLWASMGELALARGDLEGARARARQCLEAATGSNARKNLVKGWRLTGEIACAAHRWDEAHTALNEALVVARAIGNPTQLWRTHRALGAYHAARGDKAAAHEAYRAARAVVDGMLAALTGPELRASLEALPAVRELTQHARQSM
jgi:transcriptional regulator with AAA-type ATPase domain/tetratricopeptide (TPR) repeat protein